MRSRLSTCIAAVAVATMVALPLMSGGPALATDASPTTDPTSAAETTSLVVVDAPADVAPVGPTPAPAPAPEPQPEPEPEPEPAVEADTVPEPTAATTEVESPQAPSATPASPADADVPVDTTPPEFFAWTPTAFQVFNGDGSRAIDFECRDKESGIADCAFYDHNGQPQSNGTPLTLPSGTYSWTAVAVNSVGLRYEHAIKFWVPNPADTTAPSFSSGTPAIGGVYTGTGDEIVDYSCADVESPVTTCVVRDHNGVDVAPGSPLKLAAGDYTWTGIAANANGLVTRQEIKFSVGTPDSTRPTISSDWDTADGDWSNRDTITISAADSGSGIQDIHVFYDGRARLWNSVTAELELLHGSRSIEFWTVDKAGNESEHKTLQLNIDLGLPEIEVDSEIAPDGLAPVQVVQGSTIPFAYTCTDDYSGVADCTSAHTSGRALPTNDLGQHGFTVDAFDNAGNRKTRSFSYIVVERETPDTTAPSFTASTPAAGGVYTGTGDEVIDFFCSDTESAIATCTLSDQDGNPVAAGAPLELAEGEYKWTGVAVNWIGMRTTQVIEFSVENSDTTRPEVSSDWDVPAGEWSNRDTITITATDTGSGINGIWVDYDGITSVDNESTHEFEPADGTQTIEFWAADNAGNVSEHGFIDVNIDRKLPEIHVDSDIAPAGLAAGIPSPVEVVKGSKVPFTYTCTDALSGVETCTSAHASGEQLATNELGEHAFTVDAFDKAGNRTTRTFAYVVVAASGPTDPTDPTDVGKGGDAAALNQGGLASTGLELGWLPVVAITLVSLGIGLIVVRRRLNRVA